ncbi:phosphoglycerate kinase [Peptococcaceae bacterium SCADC1_2_3]|nr:phosphoglycerate kinase [Peptococcaceae bacterium SCADC1_2_3]KFI37367.1 phosphoglycerate kinase [Peptococcaceae bacterium SCADC1_2_3]HBQ29341.1 phosphoglycerate kinase [Desulfotomaculum sp.]HCJ79323.1 phosphoglycerate kinase [Desulfotomaculum sp.]
MAKKTVRDIEITGKRVLVRVDFNVPIENGKVTDDTRIKEALPTIRYLRENKAKIILISHLGRPKGKINEKYRLTPVAQRLQELLGVTVLKIDDCLGDKPAAAVKAMQPGEVILLENVRFYPEEEKNDPAFAQKLSLLADVYVNDAFGAVHRAHASTEGVAHFLPAVMGFLMEKEVKALTKILTVPERPFAAILGGVKVSDKIGVVKNLLGKVDVLLVGGGLANTFLKAQGYEVGKSPVEEDKIKTAGEIFALAKSRGVKIILPVDVVVVSEGEAADKIKIVKVDEIPADGQVFDLGPESIKIFKEVLQGAKTVFWNGPLGVFEQKIFAEGTLTIARAIAENDLTSVIGGGDTLAAVSKAGVAQKITHLSTGGGASLEFLEGKVLPGLAALTDAAK